MKAKRLQILAALLSAVMCLALLAGCASKTESTPAGEAPADDASAGEPSANEEQPREYHEDDDAYADLSFSVEPGIYNDPITIQVLGADGAAIYYTVNGHDPLVYDDEIRLDGERLDKNGFQLSDGAINLKIRAVNPETLEVSPLYSVNYIVKIHIAYFVN